MQNQDYLEAVLFWILIFLKINMCKKTHIFVDQCVEDRNY